MLGYENVKMEGPRVGECIVVPYINLHTIFDCACDFCRRAYVHVDNHSFLDNK